MEFPKEKFFHCFSPRVLDCLLNSGFEPYKNEENKFNGMYLHVITLKHCYVFERSPELCECLAKISNL